VCRLAGLRHQNLVHWCPAPTMLSLPEGKQEQAANAMNRIDYKDAPAIAEAVIGPKVAAKVRNMTKKMETVPPQKISVLVGSRKTCLAGPIAHSLCGFCCAHHCGRPIPASPRLLAVGGTEFDSIALMPQAFGAAELRLSQAGRCPRGTRPAGRVPPPCRFSGGHRRSSAESF